VRGTVHREVQLLEKNDEVVSIPGDEHFIEGFAIDVLAHTKEVGAIEFSMEAIRLEIESVTEAGQGVFTFWQNQEKIATGIEVLADGTLPVRSLNPDSFQ
jgi:hypothetical protein